MKFRNKIISAMMLFFYMGMLIAADRAQRPMYFNKVKELGLEIWTEHTPEWHTKVVYQNDKPIFIAQSPINTYPPAAMSFLSFPEMKVDDSELVDVAGSAIRRASQNYGLSKTDQDKIVISSIRHGVLTGYEGTFSGVANGEQVDVKVFVGHTSGKGIVTMQIYTLPGKLSHLDEHVRRSWGNISYLDEGS